MTNAAPEDSVFNMSTRVFLKSLEGVLLVCWAFLL